MAASGVQETLQKTTPIFTIRWVASSFRTVKAVWHSFAELSQHFHTTSEDQSCSNKKQSKYIGLIKHLKKTGLLTDLANVKDVLRELPGLSLDIQRCEMSVSEAHAAINSKILYLQALFWTSLIDLLRRKKEEETNGGKHIQ